MVKIERFVVLHRSGCGLCDPIVFKTAEECIEYITNELVMHIDAYVKANYPNDVVYSSKTTAEKMQWAEDNDLITGYCFTGYSDWEEYHYSPVKIDVSIA